MKPLTLQENRYYSFANGKKELVAVDKYKCYDTFSTFTLLKSNEDWRFSMYSNVTEDDDLEHLLYGESFEKGDREYFNGREWKALN